ncbi:MAG: hypothetical protein ATN32_01100 [Candidatus Epulonipiscium fishelsonii]|nr:MAG: hypothetical protein ATN32_01100 [Epulopiscium sp. AS2M-Bin002]
MEQTLKKQFIRCSISIVFFVILTLIIVLNTLNFRHIAIHTENVLNMIIESNQEISNNSVNIISIPPIPPVPLYNSYSFGHFSIKLDNSGNIIGFNAELNYSISEDTINSYVNKIMMSQKSEGIIDQYKYSVFYNEDITNIYFLDCTLEQTLLYTFLKNSILIGTIAFIAIFSLITIYSKKVARVIAQAYDKQNQFITGVTHELKTPITIIKGNAEVIGIQEGHTMWTKSIIEQSNRLNSLIDYLISLTKLEENTSINKEDFDISELMTESCLFFTGVAKSKSKVIEYEIQPNLFYQGDIQNIELLISILLENALKYSEAQSIIQVKLRHIKGKNTITISNKTQNLDIREYKEWFDRFYRADSSRNSGNSGFGIGLAMAKTIVVNHRGNITAESLDGKTVIIKIIL